ncbi:MAG: Zn-dependent oligopeptidase [Bacteroidetes bacterium]|nr:Zn-dependent oligopeptidase [Bacteroidota bacterium]
MKPILTLLILMAMVACNQTDSPGDGTAGNPFFNELNKVVQYGDVTHEHITRYAEITLKQIDKSLDGIRGVDAPGFDNVFLPFDKVINDLGKASSRCFMFYWVSPDSISRTKGLEGYLLLDSLNNRLSSDSGVYKQMLAFSETVEYTQLEGHRKVFVDDVKQSFEHAGVNLEPEKLAKFKELKAEISDLSSQYSINMNTANEVLKLDEAGAEGLPENFRESYRAAEGGYDIPVMPATLGPVLNNAAIEKTRKAFLVKYSNRGWEKNLDILDDMVSKRYDMARLMDYDSYASYTTSRKMSKNPEAVWSFLNDLIARAGEKAKVDFEVLKLYRNQVKGCNCEEMVNPWDRAYYANQLRISEFQVDHEVIREYLPMEQCLAGMLSIYSECLGVEYRRVANPSVWHEDVLLYEVLEDDAVTGRFYLDLYPRPNKESWFYGVEITPGKLTADGQEVPTCMLLGNFPAPTESLPSLISHRELSTLFHEFGHIMDNMSYKGEFAWQAGSKEDFAEAMSQIFENWIWDYDMLSTFARHYETGEVLPKELFDNMLSAKNITSGLDAMGSLRNCVYDMILYDKFDPANEMDTDELWRKIDKEMSLPVYVEGTHPQSCWIHINTHPTYYYGYLWAEVYAQDMFTVFEENGLTDAETGKRYRQLILANGTQRDIVEVVEEFLGRPSNNEAYIKSLGLD